MVALHHRRRTDMDEEAGISMQDLRSGDAQHMRQNEDIYGIRLHFSDYSFFRRRLRSFLFSLDPLVSGHVQHDNVSSEQASTIHLPHSVMWCLGLPQRDPSPLASIAS